MNRTILLLGVMSLGGGAGLAAPAAAQTPEQIAMFHQMAGNQLGVLEYCQGRSFIEASTVDTQRRMMTMLPPPADKTPVDAAEALGRSGTISINGNTVTLADAAKAQNVSEAALCKQMGDMVVNGAANVPGGAAAPKPAAP
ncbi:pore-forming ESAT-6 family protein [Roseomonas elaeocarpi]|uniref:Pore-forming ESAT-6 family protein n=1 Tax=Roseomonas elaeocarpi TaxID=907779 RepID=A0ABV6JSW8_9PROT